MGPVLQLGFLVGFPLGPLLSNVLSSSSPTTLKIDSNFIIYKFLLNNKKL